MLLKGAAEEREESAIQFKLFPKGTRSQSDIALALVVLLELRLHRVELLRELAMLDSAQPLFGSTKRVDAACVLGPASRVTSLV
jgi:hypothetical protein